MQPPIITSCISYASDPCASAPLTHLGDITFDATKPTLTISKVSEQFGNPTSATARKLQQTAAPLFALMLFNFSKEGGWPLPPPLVSLIKPKLMICLSDGIKPSN